MQIQQIKLSELRPYDKNPRINDAAVPKVAESIKSFGFKVPLVVDSQNVIVAGHTRFKAALQLGLDAVPCIVADDLTEQQIRAFRLADNKVAELAEWDFSALTAELAELDALDMSEFGFLDVASIEWDDVPELTEETYTEPKKKHLQCPECDHVAPAASFQAVEQ